MFSQFVPVNGVEISFSIMRNYPVIGSGIPKFTFTAHNRYLTAEEVNKAIQRIHNELSNSLIEFYQSAKNDLKEHPKLANEIYEAYQFSMSVEIKGALNGNAINTELKNISEFFLYASLKNIPVNPQVADILNKHCKVNTDETIYSFSSIPKERRCVLV